MEQLLAYKYDGFWACMDTFKEQQQLDEMYNRGKAPWEVWKFADGVTISQNLFAYSKV
jgi:glucose-1-phosphate cytidylyltransferase